MAVCPPYEYTVTNGYAVITRFRGWAFSGFVHSEHSGGMPRHGYRIQRVQILRQA